MGVYLICGGGRWARAYYTTLAEMLGNHDTAATKSNMPRVVVVSGRLATEAGDWYDLSRDHALEFVATVPPKPAGALPAIAIVASSAASHATLVRNCLANGWNVLVEKPFFNSDSTEREAILAEAEESRLALAGSFVWTFSEAIRKYASGCSPADIKHIVLDWADPPGETRHGQAKSFDMATSVLADVWPHVHGILEAMGVNVDPARIRVAFACGGQRAELTGSAGAEANLTIKLSRNATERIRKLSLEYQDGTIYALNFTDSPATIFRNPLGATPRTMEVDQGPKRPLRLQLEAFEQLATTSDNVKRGRARQAIETVCGTLDLLMEAWVRQRRAFLNSSVTAVDLFCTSEFRFALREELAGRASQGLTEGGRVDHRTIDLQISEVLKKLPVIEPTRDARLGVLDDILDDVTTSHESISASSSPT